MKKIKKLLSFILSSSLLVTSTATTLVNITASATSETSSKTEVYSLYDFEDITNEGLSNIVSNAADKGFFISSDAVVNTEIYTATSTTDKLVGKGNKALKISANGGYDWPPAGVSLSIERSKLINASSIILKVATPEWADGNGMYFQLLMKDGSVYTVKNGDDGSIEGNISTWNGTAWSERDCGEWNDSFKYVLPWDAVWVKIPLNAEKMTLVKGNATKFDKTQIVGLVIAGQSGIISDTNSLYIDEIYAVNIDNNNIDFEIVDPDASLVTPKVIINPEEQLDAHPEYIEYLDGNRLWQGIPSMAKDDESGRLWYTFYAGGKTGHGTDHYGEGEDNVCLLYTSADDGETWVGPKVVLDSLEHVRVYDPNIWVNPDGRMWFTWVQSLYHTDGRYGIWAMYTDNPDAENPTWSEPVRITDGNSLADPIILEKDSGELKAGTWVFPAYMQHAASDELEFLVNAHSYISTDEGITWTYQGSATDVPGAGDCENMIVQLNDGSLAMWIRTTEGTMRCTSIDGGKTWSQGEYANMSKVFSRFWVGRLDQETLLAVYNDPPENGTSRTYMTAALSYDEGITWTDKLVIDANITSYPDVHIDSEGNIYIAYDNERGIHCPMRMAKITKEDIVAGELVTETSKLRVLVNRNVAPTEVTVLYDFENISDDQLANLIKDVPEGVGNVSTDAVITTEIYTTEATDDALIGAGTKALKVSANGSYDKPLAGLMLTLDGKDLSDASGILLHASTVERTEPNGMTFQYVMADGSVYAITDNEDGTYGDIFTWDTIYNAKWINRISGTATAYIAYIAPWESPWVKLTLDSSRVTKVSGAAEAFDKTQVVGLVIAGQSGIISDTNSLYIDEIYALNKDYGMLELEKKAKKSDMPEFDGEIINTIYDFENMTAEQLENTILAVPEGAVNINRDAVIIPEIYEATTVNDIFIGAGNKSLKINADSSYNNPIAGFMLPLNGESLRGAEALALHVACAEKGEPNGMSFQFVMADGSVFGFLNEADKSTGHIYVRDPIYGWAKSNCGTNTARFISYVAPWKQPWVKLSLDATYLTKISGDAETFDKTQVVGLVIAGQGAVISDTVSLYIDEVCAFMDPNCDLNSDGAVNATDLTVLRQVLLTDETDVTKHDVNGDKVVDVRDLVRLKKVIAGII